MKTLLIAAGVLLASFGVATAQEFPQATTNGPDGDKIWLEKGEGAEFLLTVWNSPTSLENQTTVQVGSLVVDVDVRIGSHGIEDETVTVHPRGSYIADPSVQRIPDDEEFVFSIMPGVF